MNALDDVLRRIDAAIARLEQLEPPQRDAAAASPPRGQVDALLRRVDAALAKARAVHAALD